jgi:hypothetical protein
MTIARPATHEPVGGRRAAIRSSRVSRSRTGLGACGDPTTQAGVSPQDRLPLPPGASQARVRYSPSSYAEETSRPFETSAPAPRSFAGRGGPGKRQRLDERAPGRPAETVVASGRLLNAAAGANDGRRVGCRFDYVSGRLCRRDPATSGRRPTGLCDAPHNPNHVVRPVMLPGRRRGPRFCCSVRNRWSVCTT